MGLRGGRAALFGGLFLLVLAALGGQGNRSERVVSGFAVVQPGKDPAATALYLARMGVDEGALRSAVPTRYSLAGGRFSAEVEGGFSFSDKKMTRVGVVGGLEVYAVSGRLSAAALPKAAKTLTVSFGIAELAPLGGAVQPGLKAIELAARKAGKGAGRAWVVSMEREGKDRLVAKVGLVF